uniref:Hexosyltransferase n=1 Tax=Ciona savignyi TaxID=51511 RepID=H2YSM0_CIOSA
MKLSSIDSCLLLTVVSLTLLCSVHLYQRSVEQYMSYYRRKIVVDSETIQLTTESANLEANLVGNFYLSEPRKILMNLCHMDECSKHKAHRWRMIMFVKSSVGNTRQRELIRKTWGSLSRINGG